MNKAQNYLFLIVLMLVSDVSFASYHENKSPNIVNDVEFITKNTFNYIINPIAFALGTIYPMYRGCQYLIRSKDHNNKQAVSLADLKHHKTLTLLEQDGKTVTWIVDSEHLTSLIEKVADAVEMDNALLSRMKFYFGLGGSPVSAGKDYLNFEEEFFRSTSEEKKFMLAHEFVHILEKHLILTGCMSIAIPLATYCATKLVRSYCDRYIEQHTTGCVEFFLRFGSRLFDNSVTRLAINSCLMSKFSSYLEKRADCIAVKKLKNKTGALSCFQKADSENNFIESIKRLDFPRILGFDAHPSVKERIAYIKKLKL